MRKVLVAALVTAGSMILPAGVVAAPTPTPGASPTQETSPGPDPAAAPELQSSEPGDGEAVGAVPSEVSARFSEPLDSSSTMVVHNPCHEQVSGSSEVFANEMTVPVEGNSAGHYTVTYRAVGLGGVSGASEGTFAFHVTDGPSCEDDDGGKCGDGGHHPPGHDDRCSGNGNGSGRCDGAHGGHDEGCKGKGSGKCDGMHGGHGGSGRCGTRNGPRGGHGNGHSPGANHGGEREGGDHPGTDHDSDAHGSGGRGAMKEHGSGKHGDKHPGRNDHARHDKGGKNGNALGPLAGGRGTPGPAPADLAAVAIGLALAALMGIVGGWVLRTAPAK